MIGAALVLGCAQAGFPPGGPEDKEPPRIIGVTPDSGAVQVVPEAVVFRFDGVVSERPQGATDLGDLFLISPRDGEPRVSWKRKAIRVRPRRRWRPNTTYTVTMLPGLADLRGNSRTLGASTVFSTGAAAPSTRIRGIAFDWAAGRPLPQAAVEATARSDSTVYVTRTDSSGRFLLVHLPSGSYTLRAFADPNNNWELDQREIWDSTAVRLRDTAGVELLAFAHDSVGPGISSVTVRDSVTLSVVMDKPIDPAQAVDTALFAVQSADSTPVPLRSVRATTEADRARDDSLRAAADTGQARDTTTRQRVAADTVVRPRAPADTAGAEPAPKPSRPVPVSEVVLEVERPLAPGASYRLRARAIRGLLGQTRTSDRVFSVPQAPARDTETRRRGRPTPADSAPRPPR